MKKVLIDIGKHAGRSLERMIRRLQPDLVKSVLISSMTRKDGRYIEDDGGLFVGERVLRGGLMSEGIKPKLVSSFRWTGFGPTSRQRLPSERNFDMVFIDWKSEIKQLQLTVISV